MKPLFLFVVALATTAVTLLSSFSPVTRENTKAEPACVVAAKASASMHSAFFDAHFYWFTVPGDNYDGYWSNYEQVARMCSQYGVPCDNNPSGTLVSVGYILPSKPHIVSPFAFVFAHF
ncbi:MAG TPA: hypothetical protein VI233_18080 [Puia sp.]